MYRIYLITLNLRIMEYFIRSNFDSFRLQRSKDKSDIDKTNEQYIMLFHLLMHCIGSRDISCLANCILRLGHEVFRVKSLILH